jgi:hypothetical protein
MGTSARISFDEFLALPPRPGQLCELDEGELVMEPSPALRHNLIRQGIAMRLMQFVETQALGVMVRKWIFG